MSHPLIAGIFRCVCTHPIDPMGSHLLCCVDGNGRIGTHDVVHDTFVGFHVKWKQLHVLPSNTFNSSCWRVNIVLTKDGICTLVNVVIANLTRVDLFP